MLKIKLNQYRMIILVILMISIFMVGLVRAEGQGFNIDDSDTWTKENLNSNNQENLKVLWNREMNQNVAGYRNSLLKTLKEKKMFDEIGLLVGEEIKQQNNLEKVNFVFKDEPKEIRYDIDKNNNRKFIVTDANGKTHELIATNLPSNVDKISFEDPEGDVYGYGFFVSDKNGNSVFISDGNSFVQKNEERKEGWVVKGYKDKEGNEKDLAVNFGISNKGIVSIGDVKGWKSGVWMWGDDVYVTTDDKVFMPDESDDSAVPKGDDRHAGFVNILSDKVYEIRGVVETGVEVSESQTTNSDGETIPGIERKVDKKIKVSRSNNAIVAFGDYAPKQGEEYVNINNGGVVSGNLRSGQVESLSGEILKVMRDGELINSNGPVTFNNEDSYVDRDSSSSVRDSDGNENTGCHDGAGNEEGHMSGGAHENADNTGINRETDSGGNFGGGNRRGSGGTGGGGGSGGGSCH